MILKHMLPPQQAKVQTIQLDAVRFHPAVKVKTMFEGMKGLKTVYLRRWKSGSLSTAMVEEMAWAAFKATGRRVVWSRNNVVIPHMQYPDQQ